MQRRGGEAVNLFAVSSTTEDLLCALAAYEPAEPVRDTDGIKIVDQLPVFDAAPMIQAARSVGRFYYIAYSADCLPGRTLLTPAAGSHLRQCADLSGRQTLWGV